MSEHEDCRYWRLTDVQCFRYHVRLARRFADDARRFGEESEQHARNADRAGLASVAVLVLLVVSLLVQVIA